MIENDVQTKFQGFKIKWRIFVKITDFLMFYTYNTLFLSKNVCLDMNDIYMTGVAEKAEVQKRIMDMQNCFFQLAAASY